jgi:crossover junction endodeoxyribonuclease RusA
MTPIATYELPLPPGINESYEIGKNRKTGKRRIVSTDQHEAFKRDAALLLANQCQLLKRDEQEAFQRVIKAIKLNGGFLYLEVFFFLEDVLSRDEDGGLKVVQDSVCKHIGIDDKYVMDAHIGKRPANGKQRCEISVYLFEEKAS